MYNKKCGSNWQFFTATVPPNVDNLSAGAVLNSETHTEVSEFFRMRLFLSHSKSMERKENGLL